MQDHILTIEDPDWEKAVIKVYNFFRSDPHHDVPLQYTWDEVVKHNLGHICVDWWKDIAKMAQIIDGQYDEEDLTEAAKLLYNVFLNTPIYKGFFYPKWEKLQHYSKGKLFMEWWYGLIMIAQLNPTD